MIRFFVNVLRRNSGATVPSMDGALKPNQDLEAAEMIAAVPNIDNLARHRDGIVFSSGRVIHTLVHGDTQDAVQPLYECAGEVTALAASEAGGLAAGIDGEGLKILDGPYAGKVLAKLGNRPAQCITALSYDGPDHLIVCLGSAHNAAGDWQRDLLERRASGTVWRVNLASQEATCLAGDLAFPNGVIKTADDKIVVSESWRHQLIELSPRKRIQQRIVLNDLPGYPGRLSPAAGGGGWLAVFAPRSQLIEHVLREHQYRKRMMEQIAPEYWVAPALRSGLSFKEPLQRGGVRTQGIFKPWAPTRSYGLVVRLDARMSPLEAQHSRADGKRHGVTSSVQVGNDLLIASRGGGALLRSTVSPLHLES